MRRVADNRHKGSIRSEHGKKYAIRSVSSALRDPAMNRHVRVQGGLFDRLDLRADNAAEVMANLLAARHPESGKRLRGKVNEGKRWQEGNRVSNVCYGFDFSVSADKSVSIAGVLFQDDVVMNAAFEEQGKALRWLGRQSQRRVGKGKSKHSVPAENGVAMIVSPEKANRDGQPHIHSHGYIANLTKTLLDGDDPVWVAVNFMAMAKLALQANNRFHRRLFVRLKKIGYAVDFDGRACRLPSVPRELCQELSGGAHRILDRIESHALRNGVSSQRLAKMKDNAGTNSRPPKQFHTLEVWQQKWEAELGRGRLDELKEDYLKNRNVPLTEEKRAVSITPVTAASTEVKILDAVNKSAEVQNVPFERPVQNISDRKPTQEPSLSPPMDRVNLTKAGGEGLPFVDAQPALDANGALPKLLEAHATGPRDSVTEEEDTFSELLLLSLEMRRQYSEGATPEERPLNWCVTYTQKEEDITKGTPVRMQVLRALLRLALDHCSVRPYFTNVGTTEIVIEATPDVAPKVERLVSAFAGTLFSATGDLPEDFDPSGLWQAVNQLIARPPEAFAPARLASETTVTPPETNIGSQEQQRSTHQLVEEGGLSSLVLEKPEVPSEQKQSSEVTPVHQVPESQKLQSISDAENAPEIDSPSLDDDFPSI